MLRQSVAQTKVEAAAIRNVNTLVIVEEDSANSRPFIPKWVYPRRSIQVAGGSWAGHGG
jgi:hypothetical protein